MPNRTIIEQNCASARAFRKPFDPDQWKALEDAMRKLSRATCPGCDGSCQRAAGTRADLSAIARYVAYYEEDGKRARARELYAALPPEQRVRAFFQGWVRKEAFIKARGEGVTLGLDRFDVSLEPGRPAALLATPFDPPEADRWSMTGIDPGPDHIAAAVVEGADPRWRLWEMPPIVLP